MQFSDTESDSFWLQDFKRDVEKLNDSVNFYNDLINKERKSETPRFRKITRWNNEIYKATQFIKDREQAINKLK